MLASRIEITKNKKNERKKSPKRKREINLMDYTNTIITIIKNLISVYELMHI